MGMSTHVVGIRPADEKWLAMKRVWEACQAAGVPVPDKVRDFFGYQDPREDGVIVEIERTAACKDYERFGAGGFEVDLTKLDPTIKVLRFYNSW